MTSAGRIGEACVTTEVLAEGPSSFRKAGGNDVSGVNESSLSLTQKRADKVTSQSTTATPSWHKRTQWIKVLQLANDLF